MGYAVGTGAATAVNVVGEPEMLSNKYIFQSRTVWLIPSCPLFQIFFLYGCFGWLEELWLDSHKRIHFLFELVIMLHLDCFLYWNIWKMNNNYNNVFKNLSFNRPIGKTETPALWLMIWKKKKHQVFHFHECPTSHWFSVSFWNTSWS